MTVFWIVAAILLVAALLFVVPPLLQRQAVNRESVERGAVNVSIYKNQLVELDNDLQTGDITPEQYEKTHQEIERRLLEDAGKVEEEQAAGTTGAMAKVTALVIALAIPVVTISIYNAVGTPGAIDPKSLPVAQQASPHGTDANMSAQIEMMVDKLAQRLKENPSDIQGWVMLGRSMSVLGRYPEARDALAKAMQFAGDDPNVLTDYADAIAMAEGETLEGKPMELLAKALKIAPTHQKALWLMGTALFERGDFKGAISYWERLKNLLPPGSEDAKAMEANLQEARSYLARQAKGEFGAAPEATMAEAMPEQSKAAAGASQVTGTVTLSQNLANKVAPGDTLFIFAKAVQGPPMPLAIIRTQASDLPREFKLDETMAMMPAMSMANFSQVVVGARISKSGNAMPQSGDLQGLSDPVAVGTAGLKIEINSVVK